METVANLVAQVLHSKERRWKEVGREKEGQTRCVSDAAAATASAAPLTSHLRERKQSSFLIGFRSERASERADGRKKKIQQWLQTASPRRHLSAGEVWWRLRLRNCAKPRRNDSSNSGVRTTSASAADRSGIFGAAAAAARRLLSSVTAETAAAAKENLRPFVKGLISK